MTSTPRVLVVGAGAVGGYFGARLAQAGRDVTFLVRPARAAVLAKDGLQILSPLGDFNVRPKLVEAERIDGPYDVIFLSLKGYALQAALEDFAPAVGPSSLILPVLNGMIHMDLLAARFGALALVGGVCRIAAQLDDGRVRQLSPLHELRYGELDGQRSERIMALDALMQRAGFDAALSDHVLQDMWDKWVQLASLGAATCLLHGPVGAIVAAEGGAATATAVLDEVLAVARACGHPPSDAYANQNRQALTTAGSPLTSSMYRDMTAGQAVEVEPILGDLLRRAETSGVEAPLLRASAAALRIYQSHRSQP